MIEIILRRFSLRPGSTKRLFHSGILPAMTRAIQRPPVLLSDFRPQNAAVRLMAGHSKWQNIRHVKMANDTARSTAFSRFARLIQVAIREGKGNDPKFNIQLAHIVDVAKRANMPVSRIEGLLKEKTLKDNMTKFTFEAKGPGGAFFIMEGLTDNLKRTRQTIKLYLKKVGGSLVDNGVMHSFIHKGVINIDPSIDGLTLESAVEIAIDVGAEDVTEVIDGEDTNALQFLCEPVDFYAVKTKLQEKGFTLKTSELQYLPHSKVQLSDDHLNLMARLNDFINDDPDIMKCYDNIQ